METLKYIKDMLEVYAKQVNSLEKSGKDEERNSARNEFISNFAKLRDHFPHLLYPLYPADICMEEAEDVVRRIATLVKSNYFPIYPLSAIYIDSIGGDIIESPGIYSFQTKSFRDSTFSIYESNLDEWVMRLLLSLPLGKIELRCVNFDAYGSKSYHGKIGNNLLKTELETIVTERTAKYGNYADYCQAHKQIPEPYIVVILKDDHRGKNNKTESYFKNFYNRSAKAGIYFVILQEEKEQKECPYIMPLFKDCFHNGRYEFDAKPPQCIVNPIYGVTIGYMKAKGTHYSSMEYDVEGYSIPICYEDSCNCSSCQTPSVVCIKLTSDLAQAKKIKETFVEQYGTFPISIERYVNQSVNKVPIVKCTCLSEHKNLKKAIFKYVMNDRCVG